MAFAIDISPLKGIQTITLLAENNGDMSTAKVVKLKNEDNGITSWWRWCQ